MIFHYKFILSDNTFWNTTKMGPEFCGHTKVSYSLKNSAWKLEHETFFFFKHLPFFFFCSQLFFLSQNLNHYRFKNSTCQACQTPRCWPTPCWSTCSSLLILQSIIASRCNCYRCLFSQVPWRRISQFTRSNLLASNKLP